MQKVKVLVLATSKFSRGGIVAVVNAHAKAEFWKDWQCKWIPTHSDKSRLLSLWYFISAFFKLMWYLPQYKIVHIHLSHPASFIRKCFYFFPAYWAKRKIIIHFHAASPEVTISGWLAPAYAYVFKRAHRVIAISESWEKMIRDKVKDVSLSLVYNPSGYTNGRIVYDESNRSRYILFAGTLIPRKGFVDLIRSFAKVVKKFPDWKLVIAGNGDVDKGKQLARDLNIESKVEFTGWISGTQKEEIFQKASVFCLPSYAEGFPMAVIDAMSYGIPVLTTPVGGIMDALGDKNGILVFPPGDIDQMSNQLELMIGDFPLREQLSRNAIRVVNEKFQLHAVGSKIDEIYKSFV
jgi:glycosyltransferase involved in cell wall biosynthesis